MARADAVLLIFGLGYSGAHIAAAARARGWTVRATGSAGDVDFREAGAVLATATHVVSTVPPDDAGDPVLNRYGALLGCKWLGYLSSTGVYGDAGGAWVDESAPITGRRAGRNDADARWLALGARVFRLPASMAPAARRWSGCARVRRIAPVSRDRCSAACMSMTSRRA